MAQGLVQGSRISIGVSLNECGPDKAVAFDGDPMNKKMGEQHVQLAECVNSINGENANKKKQAAKEAECIM